MINSVKDSASFLILKLMSRGYRRPIRAVCQNWHKDPSRFYEGKSSQRSVRLVLLLVCLPSFIPVSTEHVVSVRHWAGKEIQHLSLWSLLFQSRLHVVAYETIKKVVWFFKINLWDTEDTNVDTCQQGPHNQRPRWGLHNNGVTFNLSPLTI